MIKKIICLLLVLLLTGCSNTTAKDTHIESKIYDQVIQVKTYTSFDYEYAKDYYDNKYVDLPLGCTAAYKTLEDGTTITGRNFDISLSDAPAYLFKTEVEGLYDTIGLAFDINPSAKTYTEVNENGIPDDTYKILPFVCTDYLNEEGLYIELNMRNFEVWPDGTPKHILTGTNPDADTSVFIIGLSNYIATHCKDINEAKESVDTINVYAKEIGWSYAFLMADKSGNHTILEFSNNEPIWIDDDAHANFYLNKEEAAKEQLKTGVGRYEYVKEHLKDVDSPKDMLKVMTDIRYSQVYDPDCKVFDIRPDSVAAMPHFTYDYVTDPNNQEELFEGIAKTHDYYSKMTHEEIVKDARYWITMYTTIGNCNEKSLFVTFFENDDITVKYSFDSVEKDVSIED